MSDNKKPNNKYIFTNEPFDEDTFLFNAIRAASAKPSKDSISQAQKDSNALNKLVIGHIIIDITLKIIFAIFALGLFCNSTHYMFKLIENQMSAEPNFRLNSITLDIFIGFGLGFNSFIIIILGYWFSSKNVFLAHIKDMVKIFSDRADSKIKDK
jgi:hypothetical protein